MTYLELVNEVLIRMREDTVASLGASRLTLTEDPVVDIVKLAVNDAKELVEKAHQWNALRNDWTVTMAAGTHTYALTDASSDATVESVYDNRGVALRNVPLASIHKKAAVSSTQNHPMYWAASGVDSNGDLSVRFFPTPNASSDVTVHGFSRSGPLDTNTDVLLVPAQPVIYYAFALASRERGESGGAQAGELFAMADQYLKDAIAVDAAVSDLDNDWIVR